MILNATTLETLMTSFQALFKEGLQAVPADWEKLATMAPSTGRSNTYGWLGNFPKLREWIGDRNVQKMAASGYTLVNKKFESSVGVLADDIEDDNIGAYRPLFTELGRAAALHPSQIVMALLTGGFTAECYDGQYFFDTDHPVGVDEDATTASNHQGGSGDPWFLLDTSRALKPFIFQKRREYRFTALVNLTDPSVWLRDEFNFGVDARVNGGYAFWQQGYASKQTLNATNFDLAVAAMMGFKDDQLQPLGIKPTLLVVGPGNRAAAKALIQAEKLASGASNTNFNAVDLMVTPYLT